MLDPKFVRANAALVRQNTSERMMDSSLVDSWVSLDNERKELLPAIEKLRKERKGGSKEISQEERERIREAKTRLSDLEEKLKAVEAQWLDLLNQIPNMHSDDTPKGASDKENIVLYSENPPKHSFSPKDHVDLMEPKGLVDFERGAKVAGSQFYFLKGNAVLLEMAISQFVLDLAVKKGYQPLHTPDVARSKYYLGTGYNPRGKEAQTYEIAGEDLGLIATAEVTAAGYHADEVFSTADLPKKYIALSHCFRKESGAYGKYSRGLYRVHQFTKLELFVYCRPEDSLAFHEEILGMEKQLMEELAIPYRVLAICAGDLGSMAAKKYDVEAWMPGRGDFGEVTSASNVTDYQARNLNIKYKDQDGSLRHVHMLNGTAAALSRVIIAIVENYQQEDGSIRIPEALQPYFPGNPKTL